MFETMHRVYPVVITEHSDCKSGPVNSEPVNFDSLRSWMFETMDRAYLVVITEEMTGFGAEDPGGMFH